MPEGVYAQLLRRLSRRAGLRLFRFFDRPVDGAYRPPPLARYDVRLVSDRELMPACADPALDLREDSVTAAYSRGDLCAAAYEGKTLAGYCWLAFAPLPHLDGVWVRFGDDVAWVYKSFVRPSHRGRRIGPFLYRFADEQCRNRGRTRSMICVERHNAPSLAAALRAGYEDAGYAGYVRRQRLFIDWYSKSVRRRGVAFYVPQAV